MSVGTALAIYFLIWWLVLFTVLPWGIRSQHEGGGEIAPGTDPGAPAIPNLRWKLVWTTLVSVAVFAVFDVIYVYRLVTIDGLMAPFLKH
jgi:predicted secreted protein